MLFFQFFLMSHEAHQEKLLKFENHQQYIVDDFRVFSIFLIKFAMQT
jgi:hypothetical protein